MDDANLIDKKRLRRAFEHAAAGYDAAAVLQQEVCRRMLARLDYIKFGPRAILDAGAGTGNVLESLRARYRGADIVALDLALAMLERARRRIPWWKQAWRRTRVTCVCGDLERLPLKAATMGMVWSNLALQWINEPARAFDEVLRVLVPGGVFMFSTFGPDTLRELRAAFAGVDSRTHVHRFIDMHDLGDMLVRAGFADPVMDMEYINLTYADVVDLMRDLKAIGAHNATRGRPQALSTRKLLTAVRGNYEPFRRDGKLPATFEVVYGHAWKPETPRRTTGEQVVKLHVKRPQ